jgi:hypothetical protein
MKAILLLALSVIILSQSYGLAYSDHGGSSHATVTSSSVSQDPIVTVETDSSSYETGDSILIHGSISDYKESDPFKNFDVTLRVIAPNNNIISISQVSLDNDGSYSSSIIAGGPLWSIDGDYMVSASHGEDRSASVIFAFVDSEAAEAAAEEAAEAAAEEAAEAVEEELEKGCGEGTHLEDGVCVLDETIEAEVPVSTGTSPSTGFNSWIYSISFTVLIAFAIMIILYLISRASRNKSDD